MVRPLVRVLVALGLACSVLVGGTPQAAAAPVAAPLVASGPAAGTFVALDPVRVLDTRSGLGASGPVVGNSAVSLQVAGKAGVPALVAAVVLNVTVTEATSFGFVTVYPDGESVPTASNLNYAAGQTVPNLVTVKVGANGKVALRVSSSGSAQLVADLAGFYVAGTPTVPGAFVAQAPVRVLDTRSGVGAAAKPVGPGGSVKVLVAKADGPLPSAVVMNVTVTEPTAAGFVTAYPSGMSLPTVSNVNYGPAQTIPNLVTVKVGADGCVVLTNSSKGTVQLVADLAGYYLPGSATAPGAFVPVEPYRVLDTRESQPSFGDSLLLALAGRGALPQAGMSAVVANVTATRANSFGFLTVTPYAAPLGTSNLNFAASQTVPNLVVAATGLDARSTWSITANSPAGMGVGVQVIVDVAGYFKADAGGLAWRPAREALHPTGDVSGLSCSGSTCLAVDGHGNVMRWTGAAWTQPTPVPGIDAFTDISCASPTFCVAVGRAAGTPTSAVFDGSAWRIVGGFGSSAVWNVSCPTSTWCLASDDAPALWAFNGTSWTKSPAKHAVDRAKVACWAPGGCVVADTAGDLYRLDGSALTKAPITVGSVTGADCWASAQCRLVDIAGRAITYNNGTWQAVQVPGATQLYDMSCPAADSCVATGNGSFSVYRLSGGSWVGSSSALSGPNLVDCPGSTDCRVITFAGDGATFNGSGWSYPAPMDHNSRSPLVSCSSASGCWAADSTGRAAHWNGSTWSAPTWVAAWRAVTDLSCPTDTFCVAAIDNDLYSFDGQSWSRSNPGGSTTPFVVSCSGARTCVALNGDGDVTELDGSSTWSPLWALGSGPQDDVSCASPTACVAVDRSGGAIDFDGASWGGSQVFPSGPGSPASVSCVSASDCLAVLGTQAARFDGASWASAPTVPTRVSTLTCASTGLCLALDRSGPALTPAPVAWDGSAWTKPFSLGLDQPRSASCVAGLCMVIGEQGETVVGRA